MSEFKFKIGDKVVISNPRDIDYNKQLTVSFRYNYEFIGNMYKFKETQTLINSLTRSENNLRKLEDLEDLYV